MDYHKFIFFKRVKQIKRRHSTSIVYDVLSFLKGEVAPQPSSWEADDEKTSSRTAYLRPHTPFPLASAYMASTK